MTPRPSPFPGMDPYLEAPALWSSVHTRLIVGMSDAIAALLPAGYSVDIEQRVYATSPGDADRSSMEPDVFVVQEAAARYRAGRLPSPVTPPTLVEPPETDPEIRDRFLEIRDSRTGQVITVIELLSPFNKRPGAQGYDAFQEKRRRIMASRTHWLEIDLLRKGERPREVTGRADYYALLKRGDRLRPYEVWFFDLPNPLPTVAVPLRPPQGDLPLDLQAILADVYARARYGENLDYSGAPPPPPLTPDNAAWAHALIRAWAEPMP